MLYIIILLINVRISQLENLFKKRNIRKKHKVVFKFKHKKLKGKKYLFHHLINYSFRNAIMFANEIKKTFNYYKNLK